MRGSVIIKNKKLSCEEFASKTLPNEWNWLNKSQLFIKEWLTSAKSFKLKTSGSTGQPKALYIGREQMEASAKATLSALNLGEGSTALLCMNPDTVGGRMMLVRSLLGNWSLHISPPNRSPIIDADIDFTAMVPLQVKSLLNSQEGERFLNRIGKLIIGGASISKDLDAQLQLLKTEVYQTFGMTESVSHIALRRVNGGNKSQIYRLIGDNEITIDKNGLLSIKGSVTKNEWLKTNDIVEMVEGGFRWIGRADLVVNSGGVKILIENLEKKIKDNSGIDALVWKTEDNQLGERAIGIVKSKEELDVIMNIKEKIKEALPQYHFPKEWYINPNWTLTESGKINRSLIFSMIEQKK